MDTGIAIAVLGALVSLATLGIGAIGMRNRANVNVLDGLQIYIEALRRQIEDADRRLKNCEDRFNNLEERIDKPGWSSTSRLTTDQRVVLRNLLSTHFSREDVTQLAFDLV